MIGKTFLKLKLKLNLCTLEVIFGGTLRFFRDLNAILNNYYNYRKLFNVFSPIIAKEKLFILKLCPINSLETCQNLSKLL